MYSQKSFNKPLGKSTTTIKSNGCFLVSICNLINEIGLSKMNPFELNELFILKGVFSGANIIAANAAKALGISYAKTYEDPNVVCVCETDNYKKVGFPQHFFLYSPKTKMRVDPLDLFPVWESNNYHIVSYRVFTWNHPQAPTNLPISETIPEPSQPEIIAPASIPSVQEQSTTLNPNPSVTSVTTDEITAGTIPTTPTETVEKYKPGKNIFELIINYLLKVWNSIKKQ